MNRELLFRGKQEKTDSWVYGNLIIVRGEYYILTYDDDPWTDRENDIIECCITPVKKDTVGQYTGVDDSRGTMIFEGDVIGGDEEMGCTTRVAQTGQTNCMSWVNKDLRYLADMTPGSQMLIQRHARTFTVLGNIHDNPELLSEHK